MIFHCEVCDRCCPEVCCDQCLEITLDGARWIDESLPLVDCPDAPIDCAVVTGHWGDVLVALSTIKNALDQLGQRSCDILYWGDRPEVLEIVAAQDFVRAIYCADVDKNYMAFQWFAWLRSHTRDELRKNLPHARGVNRATVYVDGLINSCPDKQTRTHPMSAELPKFRQEQADRFLKLLFGSDLSDVVLLHPISTWSVSECGHWPFWHEAVGWLLDHSNARFLMTGLEPVEIEHPRLSDAIGLLESNLINFGIARRVPAVFSTCNSVAIWATSVQTPAFILPNRDAGSLDWNPFRRFMDRNENVFLGFDASFDEFVTAAEKFLTERGLIK